VYLQVNTGKYNADCEIMKSYEYLQIVQSQFFTDKLKLVSIWYNSNIYWIIGIQI
jgi:hypothetical protein